MIHTHLARVRSFVFFLFSFMWVAVGPVGAQSLSEPEIFAAPKEQTGEYNENIAASPTEPTIYAITSLNDSGQGSLRECMEAIGSRVCVFSVSGWIHLVSDIVVSSPQLTVAGLTAPSPGVMLRGSGIVVQASNVLIQDIYVRPGDDLQPDCCTTLTCEPEVGKACSADPGSRDGIRIVAAHGPISNITIDHVSIQWALDEGLSVVSEKGEVSNVKISNSIIASGLDLSIHPEASNPLDPGHSKGVYITGTHPITGLSFLGNLLAHNADRNIRVSVPVSLEFNNNIVYNWARGKGTGRTIELANTIFAQHAIDLIGNVFLPGPDSFCYSAASSVFGGCFDALEARSKLHSIIRVGGGALSPFSRYYLFDNFGPTRSSPLQPEWDAADKGFFQNRKLDLLQFPENRSDRPVASKDGWIAMSSGEAQEYVLRNAGARPNDRDSVDEQTIQDVRTRSGRIINCVSADGTSRCEKNAGGWPLIAPQVEIPVADLDPIDILPDFSFESEATVDETARDTTGLGFN